MAYGKSLKALFNYSYKPLGYMSGPDDGGFCVNLFDNDTMLFQSYTPQGRVVAEYVFALPAQMRIRYMAMIQPAGQWLGAMPHYFRSDTPPGFKSYIGLSGMEIFVMEDLPSLIVCPFRSVRGHYARMMYNLLEDITGLMVDYGLELKLDSFEWNSAIIQPMQPKAARRFDKSG